MNSKPDFFIGWQEKTPPDQKKALRRFLFPVFILLPVLAYFLVAQQKGFNDHQFELGQLREIKGVYSAQPVPILKASPDQLPEGIDPHILLVGYGKFGAEGIIEDIERQKGDLNGLEVSLAGTLIFGDGKAVMELTEKEKSIGTVNTAKADISIDTAYVDQQELSGEILDPKCYFGVMKPGEGKIHKSCAIRCISGGIPPVFRVGEPNAYTYYILQGANGEKINQAVLDYIGEPISLSGKTASVFGWQVLRIDPATLQ